MRAGELVFFYGAVGCLAALVGCSSPAPAPAPVRAADANQSSATAYRAGRVHFGGRQLAVVPFIGHQPEMDLRVQCLAIRDNARRSGQPEVPLCFGDSPREAVRSLRLERTAETGVGQIIRRLAASNDSAHFIVEPSGSIYQILDLSFAPRRGGALQPGEIRVIAADPEGLAALRDALTMAIDGLVVEDVPADAPTPAPPAHDAPAEAPHEP